MTWPRAFKILAVSLSVIVVTGCKTATGPPFVPNEYYAIKEGLREHPDKAAVYVYRPDFVAPFQTLSLRINGEPISGLRVSGYSHYLASPGRTTYSITWNGDQNVLAALPIQIEGGKAYFIRVRWREGLVGFWPSLELVSDEIKALNDLDQCRQNAA